MKGLFLGAIALLIGVISYGQFSISGTIFDPNGSPLMGATVSLEGSFQGDVSNLDGTYVLSNLDNGNYTITATYIGLKDVVTEVVISDKDQTLDIHFSEEVYSIHPVAVEVKIQPIHEGSYENLDKEEIENYNYGQDFPYMLRMTPSMIVSSDAGAGIGYTSMRLRGSDQTRINVTINGVPLNDAESHNVFWVDLPDFASSTEDVQVQRGVGSSTNGSGAFGASVNIRTLEDNPEAYVRYSGSIGSFDTYKNSLAFSSGKVGKHWNFDGRYSKLDSEGFIDRGSADLESFYFSGAYIDKDFSLKGIIMTGHERTYQAWNGVPEAKLNGDMDALETHIANNGYTDAEIANLKDPSNNRTYNVYEYENQVDDYGQDHYQLLFSKRLSSGIKINSVLHYTYGAGYFEQFREDDDYVDYGLNPLMIGGDTINSTDLIRRRWLDNHFYGITFNISKDLNRGNFVLGGAANRYDGQHFGRIIWAENASNSFHDTQYYTSNGVKDDINIYAKYTQIYGKLAATLDMQLRTVEYTGAGFNNDRVKIDIDEYYAFFNPKVLLTYDINDRTRTYFNFGVANREPVRSDFEDANLDEVPDPERLTDFELGISNAGKKHLIEANVYYMRYKDQLVLTGAVNDVGAPVRTNVDNSYRAGIEILYGYQFNDKFRWTGNVALSQNKIKSYEEVIVDYSDFSLITTTLEDQDIAFSPNLVLSNIFSYSPVKNLTTELLTKHVSRQYMDNTTSESKSLDPYLVNDLLLTYKFTGFKAGDLSLGFQINNLLDEEYETFGYTYSYKWGDLITENFYYPQAGRNYMFKLILDIYDKK